MSDRIPPYSEEAERGALGAMLMDPLRLIAIARNELKIEPDNFFIPAHQTICAVLFEMMEKQMPIDSLTLTQHLRDKELLDGIGGSITLDRLIDNCPTATHGEHYLDIVRQKAILRKEIYLCREIEEEARRAERGDEHVAGVPERFASIVSAVTVEVSNAEIMARRMEKWRAANHILAKQENREATNAMGLPTPWRELTLVLCGWDVGLNIICGRPSQGKTTLAGEAALHLLELGIPGAILEMDITTDRFLQRCACRKAGVSLAKVKQGYAGLHQLDQLKTAQEEIAKYPVYMNDWDRDVGSALSWIRAEKMKHGIEWAVIDHMTCMTDSSIRENANFHTIYGMICHKLKAASLKLKIPILLLWQLTKENDKEGRAPILSDLRETGSGEEDASVVVSVYRDNKKTKAMEEEVPGSTKNKRPTWVECLKNQDGETGRLPFWFLGSYFQFQECDGFEAQEENGTADERGRTQIKDETAAEFEGLSGSDGSDR